MIDVNLKDWLGGLFSRVLLRLIIVFINDITINLLVLLFVTISVKRGFELLLGLFFLIIHLNINFNNLFLLLLYLFFSIILFRLDRDFFNVLFLLIISIFAFFGVITVDVVLLALNNLLGISRGSILTLLLFFDFEFITIRVQFLYQLFSLFRLLLLLLLLFFSPFLHVNHLILLVGHVLVVSVFLFIFLLLALLVHDQTILDVHHLLVVLLFVQLVVLLSIFALDLLQSLVKNVVLLSILDDFLFIAFSKNFTFDAILIIIIHGLLLDFLAVALDLLQLLLAILSLHELLLLLRQLLLL